MRLVFLLAVAVVVVAFPARADAPTDLPKRVPDELSRRIEDLNTDINDLESTIQRLRRERQAVVDEVWRVCHLVEGDTIGPGPEYPINRKTAAPTKSTGGKP